MVLFAFFLNGVHYSIFIVWIFFINVWKWWTLLRYRFELPWCFSINFIFIYFFWLTYCFNLVFFRFNFLSIWYLWIWITLTICLLFVQTTFLRAWKFAFLTLWNLFGIVAATIRRLENFLEARNFLFWLIIKPFFLRFTQIFSLLFIQSNERNLRNAF